MKNFWYAFIAMQMKGVGQALKAQDANNTGTDDVVGMVLDIGGDAVGALTSGDIKTTNGKLKAIADGIYRYLGLTPIS